ncbi:MAG: DUF3866 family protein [Firmicutes bacterium]|nr:DUF3866 family protein [Bacillota bacterium]
MRLVEASVEGIRQEDEQIQILIVRLGDGREATAINEVRFFGRCKAGESLWLNSEAVERRLGTGGVYFVAGRSQPEASALASGHIMKLRYTPLQFGVNSVEAPESPYHASMQQARNLDHLVVVAAELHSQVEPIAYGAIAAGIHRIAYIMTEGGSLPIAFSQTIRRMRQEGRLLGSITVGQAFGGDLEAVNIYSALLAARNVLHADLAIVAMGPGIVGTNTPFGFSGMEVATTIHATAALGGVGVMTPRISFAEHRERHYGLSHHTRTLLSVLLAPCWLPLPTVNPQKRTLIAHQLEIALSSSVFVVEETPVPNYPANVPWRTMGRRSEEDPIFFDAAAASGFFAGQLVQTAHPHPGGVHWQSFGSWQNSRGALQ